MTKERNFDRHLEKMSPIKFNVRFCESYRKSEIMQIICAIQNFPLLPILEIIYSCFSIPFVVFCYFVWRLKCTHFFRKTRRVRWKRVARSELSFPTSTFDTDCMKCTQWKSSTESCLRMRKSLRHLRPRHLQTMTMTRRRFDVTSHLIHNHKMSFMRV